jgi:hypothetical protein
MTWLAWRQARAQTGAAAAALVVVLAVLVATHGHVAAAADPTALPNSYQSLRLFGTGLIGVPAFLGAFWGAPLVARELETGTYRMVWTQSVSRARWLLTRLLVIGVAAAVLTAVFSLVFTWWSAPFDAVGNRIGTANFGQRGIAPVAYALFAISLGALFSAVIRRTLPAMTATLASFMVVRLAFQSFVRAHLGHTVWVSRPTALFEQHHASALAANGWVHATRLVDAQGHVVSQRAVERAMQASCHLTSASTSRDLGGCVNRLGYHDLALVHPGSAFWSLQLWEAACFVGLAVALGAATVWWLNRRLG